MWFSNRKKREAEQRQHEIEMTWYAPMSEAVGLEKAKGLRVDDPIVPKVMAKINEPLEVPSLNAGHPASWSTVDFKTRKYRFQLPPLPLEVYRGNALFNKRGEDLITIRVKQDALKAWKDDLKHIVSHPGEIKEAATLYRQEREWRLDSALFM